MKVKALKEFEKYTDKERNDCKVKEGDTWETSKERANFLLSKGLIEILEDGTIEHPYTTIKPKPIIEEIEQVEYQNVEDKKPKKTSKKKQ